MSPNDLNLPSNPAEARALLEERSRTRPVVVFKKSLICPISERAEGEFLQWREGLPPDDGPLFAMIDVIAERPLARGLTAELGITHQSPQALVFREGKMVAHESHSRLTQEWFRKAALD